MGLLVAVGIFAAQGAFTSPTASFAGKRTSVEFSQGFVDVLAALEVNISRVLPAKLRNNGAVFPIPAAEIDLENAAGEILHTGGLALKSGNTVVQLSLFIIDTGVGGGPVLTG